MNTELATSSTEQLIEAINHSIRTPLGVALGLLRDAAAGYALNGQELTDGVQALERIERILRLLREEVRCPCRYDGGSEDILIAIRDAANEVELPILLGFTAPAASGEIDDTTIRPIQKGFRLIFRSLRARGATRLALHPVPPLSPLFTLFTLSDQWESNGSDQREPNGSDQREPRGIPEEGGYLMTTTLFESPKSSGRDMLSAELLVALGNALLETQGISITIEEQNGSFRGIVRYRKGHNPL